MPALERHEDLARSLDEELRRRLASGDHEAVAHELAAAGRHREAGWVLEQIWAFAGATDHYLAGERWLDALRTAIEEGRPDLLDGVLARIADVGTRQGELIAESSRLLERRGLHAAAARLLALVEAAPERQAEALLRSGDRLAAALAFAEAGQPRQALAALGPLSLEAGNADEHALAARLRWDLGDAEGTARHAQAARRVGTLEGERGRRVRTLLARALASLGHDLAGQLVLGEGDTSLERSPIELLPHGRYRVTGMLPAAYAGAAYVGIDRVTLQEVELHLLLAEYAEHDKPAIELQRALERFAATATAADALGHPAIRPILRIEPREGLLVMPRREGPLLRSLIRPPGLEQASARARSVVAFMLDGLATAHAAGLVHGSLLPSQIVCDALGRPLLGAFGAHQLAGLIATRTGGLEELLAITPPEQRSGGAPSPAGDVYMIGALWAALLAGHFVDGLAGLATSERETNGVLVAMLAERPEDRPSARAVLAQLQLPVEDLSELAKTSAPSPEESVRAAILDPRLGRAIAVVADERWTDALLDALCLCRNPWLQNILDREGRSFQLAAWPEGCRALAPGQDWRALLDPQALELLSPSGEPNELGELHVRPSEALDVDQALRDAVVDRLDRLHARGESALVVTPAGEFMLALDRLLGL
ncbi:hypothetical protein ACNOYE_37125 [Nannocystaceae bacterium ST9]